MEWFVIPTVNDCLSSTRSSLYEVAVHHHQHLLLQLAVVTTSAASKIVTAAI